jgi:hypothetical protein
VQRSRQPRSCLSLTTLAPGAADLWVEGKVIYVPLTQTGELVALTVE